MGNLNPSAFDIETIDPVLCPDCGWTGTQTDLDATDGTESCPMCDTDIEIID